MKRYFFFVKNILFLITFSFTIIYSQSSITTGLSNINNTNYRPISNTIEKDVQYIDNKIMKIIEGQSETGSVYGKVNNENGEPLPQANVFIMENHTGAATDFNGYYEITNLAPGTYTIKASFVGYKDSTKEVIVLANQRMEVNFILFSESFQIGGITVTAEQDLIPIEPNTKTVISSGEIEHYQASSLGEVLDLVPGVEKQNPGLDKTSQISIRGDVDDNLSRFGTKVIIDGTPESNNANLQFETLSGSKFGGSNINGGVDLRTIPADNIESIEIISGLPSVRYGDFTQGIIDVKTKIGAAPNRFKVKNNPYTSEANLGGGFMISEDAISYNLNVAYSERDIRLTGDEYIRYTGQVVYSNLLFDSQLKSNFKLQGQFIRDEKEPNDLTLTKDYNRGFSLGFTSWGTYKPQDDLTSWDYNAYVKMDRINSKRTKLVQSGIRIINGDTTSSYIGCVENKGIEWTVGGRLEWKSLIVTGSFFNNILIGSEVQYDANTGEGLILDTLFNYYGADSRVRPYSFNDIPGQTLLSIYAEDKITGNLLVDFSLVLGFRYDMYRPYDFNIQGLWGDGDLVESHQGTYFNPRANLILYFSDFNQLRMSIGRTSKSPSMGIIYPPETVFSWRNPNDSIVYYFRYNQSVPNLKGYTETQYEVSYDHKFFDLFGISMSAYYNKRHNQPSEQPIPVFFEDNSTGNPIVYFIDAYGLPENIGINFSKGIEVSLKTAKIKPLNLDFTFVGSYNFSKKPGCGISYSNTPDVSKGQYPNYQVPGVAIDTLIGWTYPSSGEWQDRIQLNYYFKYTHKDLGLWVTLRIEQVIQERYQYFDLTPVVFDMLTDDAKATRLFDESIKTRPNKWLFNLSISKSLFPGAEVSFYVNNLLDDMAVYRYWTNTTTQVESARNPELSYGLEFSMMFDKIF